VEAYDLISQMKKEKKEITTKFMIVWFATATLNHKYKTINKKNSDPI
jgi:hypothetical protein